MGLSRHWLAGCVALALLCVACGADEETERTPTDGGTTTCAEGERAVIGKGCLGPGVQDNGCPAGALGLDDGSCLPAGVPPEACANGFAPDGAGGCDPILPSEPCADGQIAWLGETRCHELAPCGSGTWGDIPISADTVFVDASYTGGNSDGSQPAPWTTIQDGVAAAARGAVVAIAAGSYEEDIQIARQAVTLWGRCPGSVEIVGSGSQLAAVQIEDGASGTAVRGLAIRGTAVGVFVSGSEDVVFERVWIHDLGSAGFVAQGDLGPTSVVINDSLIEDTHEVGVFLMGVGATIDRTVVRETRPNAVSDDFGCGIDIQDDSTGQRANATLTGSIVEQNRYVGVFVGGADATIEGTLIRDTAEGAAQGRFGRGIEVEDDPSTDQRGSLGLRGSVVATNREIGVSVIGSDAIIEATVVRDTQSAVDDGVGGEGIAIWDNHATPERGGATIRSSLVAGNHETGIVVGGSDAIIEATLVRDTQPRALDGIFGSGIQFGMDVETSAPSSGTVRASVVERNFYVGVGVFGGTLTVEGTRVQGTAPSSDGTYGDGVAVIAVNGAGEARIVSSVIGGSARAAVSAFGAHVTAATTQIECNAIDLDGETVATPFAFEDLGGNVCGCNGELTQCQVSTSSIAAPQAVELPQ